VTASDVLNLLGSVVQGAGVSAVFLLVLFIGISVVVGYVKLRPSGPSSLTVRSLDEALGDPVKYLAPDSPRGTADQLGGSGRAA
jgi:hypothetical protein